VAWYLLSAKDHYADRGEKKMDASKGKDWRELCAEVAEEPDSERVISLVNQILQAFDECDQKKVVAAERHADVSGEDCY
jgi:hypothetical protein